MNSNNSEILYIGQFLEDSIKNNLLKSQTTYNFSAHNFEVLFLKGFINNDYQNIELLSLPAVGFYPKYFNKLWIKKTKFLFEAKIKAYTVSFINIFYLKKISMAFAGAKYALKWLKCNEKKETILIGSSADFTILLTLYIIRVLKPEIKTCLIVPDLPDFLSLDEKISSIRKIIAKTIRKISNKIVLQQDSFVLLTDGMREKLKMSNKPYMVMEGMIDPNFKPINKKHIHKKSQIILYTGTLRKVFGIEHLLKAFRMIANPNLELWICGKGEAESDIIEMEKIDTRVKYMGLVSPESVRNMQVEADILINPRKSEGEYTKYSFPSKIMEYLSSGTPTIMYKLEGIPEEYFQYIITPKNETIEELAKTIDEVSQFSEEEKKRIGLRAKEFVFNHKTNTKQVFSILNFINTL